MNREKELEMEKAYVDDEGFIHIENVVICSKNFSGLEKRNPHNPKQIVNSDGNRNFSIMLSQEVADLLSNFRLVDHPDKAFKIQVKLPTDDSEEQTPKIFMTVKVKYRYDEKGRPYRSNPKIRQYSSKGASNKTEDNVGTIDDVYIERATIIFNPGPYDVNGNIGLTPWLIQMNYKIKENELDAKWDQDYMTDTPDDYEEEPF